MGSTAYCTGQMSLLHADLTQCHIWAATCVCSLQLEKNRREEMLSIPARSGFRE